jgi:hypothetical protein
MRGGLEAGHHHQAGGLSGPGRSEHGHEFSPLEAEIEVSYDKGLAVIGFLHFLEENHRLVGGRAFALRSRPGLPFLVDKLIQCFLPLAVFL